MKKYGVALVALLSIQGLFGAEKNAFTIKPNAPYVEVILTYHKKNMPDVVKKIDVSSGTINDIVVDVEHDSRTLHSVAAIGDARRYHQFDVRTADYRLTHHDLEKLKRGKAVVNIFADKDSKRLIIRIEPSEELKKQAEKKG